MTTKLIENVNWLCSQALDEAQMESNEGMEEWSHGNGNGKKCPNETN